MSEKKAPSTPLPATTVLLVRPKNRGDANSPLEVFMVVRHHKIDSFSGALVFPGGKLEDADADPRLRARCAGAQGIPDAELAFRVAGIREAFEECGILLAMKRGDQALIGAAELKPIEDRWRDKLAKDDASIVDMVEAEAGEAGEGGERVARGVEQQLAPDLAADVGGGDAIEAAALQGGYHRF